MSVPAVPDGRPAGLEEAPALELLAHGELAVQGRMTTASNATLLATVSAAGLSAQCIYKPVLGERPLRDFPPGTLGRREVAAYQLSRATGWDVVPPTVWRSGPYGDGSVQLWVDDVPPAGVASGAATSADLIDVVPLGAVPDGWLAVLRAQDADGVDVVLIHADDPRLARLAVFDAVIDNADRKGGHVLVDQHGHVWGVDHGLSFNVDDKLRTVLWGWQGRPLPAECRDVLAALATELGPEQRLAEGLGQLLTRQEVDRTRERVDRLVRTATFPRPDRLGPLIPWPPF